VEKLPIQAKVDSLDWAVGESAALFETFHTKESYKMKTILLYAWGGFLALVMGFAVVLGIAFVESYVDNRIIDAMRILAPDRVAVDVHILFLESRLADPSVFQVRFIALAVTLWTFEGWRQRQRQIQRQGKT
jgi:hypothetical protein